jgi:hypothetical protein
MVPEGSQGVDRVVREVWKTPTGTPLNGLGSRRGASEWTILPRALGHLNTASGGER